MTIKGYCTSLGTVETETSGTITVGGNYKVPVFTLVTTRKPLSSCIHSGIITFNVSGGVTPYRIKILQAPNAALVGKEYSFSTAQQAVGSLPVGDYVFEVGDNCRTAQRNYTLEAVSVNKITIGTFYPDKTPSTICNTVKSQLNPPTNSTSDDLRPYLYQRSDTVNKYFKLQWYDALTPDIKNDISVPNGQGSLPQSYLTFPGGFEAVRGHTIVVEQTFQDAVLTECSENTVYTSSKTLSTYVGGSYFNPDPFIVQGTCEMGIYFPYRNLSNASYTSLHCSPITYSIKYRGGDKDGQVVPGMENLVYNYYDANGKYIPVNQHFLEEGNYTLVAADASNGIWNDQNFTVSAAVRIPTPSVSGQVRSRSARDYGEEDKYLPYSVLYYYSSWSAGTVVEFTSVPEGSTEVEVGTKVTLSNATEFLYPNIVSNSNNFYYLVPGDYTVSITTPCASPQYSTFRIYEPSLNNWGYTLEKDCDNFKLIPDAGISTTIHTTTSNTVYARIGWASNENVYNTNWVKIDGTNYLSLPGAGTYKIYFSTDPNTQIMTNYCYFIRTVTVDPVEFVFDESQTIAYTCPGDNATAIIRGMATGGTAPYTYELQKKTGVDSSGNPVFEDAGLAKQVLDEGVPAVFDYLDGKEGDVIRIVATETCSSGSTTINTTREITSLHGKITISGMSSACVGDDITLKVTNIPGAAYTWQFGGTVIPGQTTSTLSIDNIRADQLGVYTAEVLLDGCAITLQANVTVNAAPARVVWSPTGTTDEENRNWNRPENWTPNGIPASCTDVYVPGGLT